MQASASAAIDNLELKADINISSITDASDEELIEQSKQGNHSAFRVIVERYEPVVAATVIGMLGSSAEVDDVGQETFVRLYKSLNKFRGDAKLSTYLTRIAINLSLDALRRQQRNRLKFWAPREEDSLPDELTIDSSGDIDANERREIVRRAVQMLDPKHRVVVVLRMLQGYSTKETAALLKIPAGTVLSRLSRAEDKLKNLLEPLIEDL
ncbi:RNA polymerase subunit sigma-24 [candidate division LCP-89 bacterium B3_LCP]|uniref:RNA polymerase subunit sigma-24 n=1 Tax=candidate division LCP-89 bacterium B3_LCP TaxID=2012998 RepID=A0A532UQN4_UNCL8|nr:MAG: RNA polymerase subunit sigma-24 [candidate division LCP-89 bacterium B3_LCP]